MRRDDEHGFTLVELLIVMVIIGILAAIAIPVFLKQRQSGYDAQAKSDLRGLATAEELHLTEAGSYDKISVLKAANEEVLATKDVTVSVVFYNGSTGYCLSAKHSQSSSVWFYDSRNYGMQPAGSTGCPISNVGLPGDSLAG